MTENRYDQKNIDTMERVYGRGYLSAGGDEEVIRVLHGLELSGRRVLDLGCGLGGASVALVERLHAAEVVAYDIDDEVLKRARDLIHERDVEDRIELVKGVAGPLSFDEGVFDVVHVTAVSCHIHDLVVFFQDIHRVLKPGGWVVGAEWLIKERNDAYHQWDDLLRARRLNFYFVDKITFQQALQTSGFHQVRLVDRTAAYVEYAASAKNQVMGDLKPGLLCALGEKGYQDFLEWTHARHRGLAGKGLLQQHFRGQK